MTVFRSSAVRGLPSSLCVLMFSMGAGAQAPAVPPSSAPQELQRVEITGTSNANDRKDATAAKFVVSREDLMRFGDTSVTDVLRRVPGLSVGGSGTQGREVRLRGLGSGYTQILVNGEPVAAGFEIDSISPDLIERIEVIRSAQADSSTQAIAGTVNIILRRSVRSGQRDLKLSASTYDGLGSGSITGQFGDKSGTATYSLSSNLNYERDNWPSTTQVRAHDSGGAPLFTRSTGTQEQGKRLSWGITPRTTWKPDDNQTVSLDGLLLLRRFEFHGEEVRTTLSGTEPDFASNQLDFVNEMAEARLSGQWQLPVGKEGRVDAKASVSVFRRNADSRLQGWRGDSAQVLLSTVASSLQDVNLSLSGKYSLPIGEHHTFGSGWDGRSGRRSEDRIQRERSSTGYPTQDLDEDYDADIHRLALYAQDEWAMTARLSAYLGLRWEGIETRTRGNVLAPVKNHFSVFSPTSQLLWKVPDTESDQVRVSLGRTYKAPTSRDLIPRRWVVTDNTATTPNFQGNPALAPELAWGLDVGYERYLPEDGFLGISAYARRIDGVILQRVYQDGSGTWISTPANSGKARVFGVELEAKGRLSSWIKDAPHVEWRSGLTRNVSTVDDVPGPGNRLSAQPSLTASVGADYRPKGASVTMGGNFAFEKGGDIRISSTQTLRSAHKRSLDVFAIWAIDKGTQLQVTVLNLLKPDGVVHSGHADAALDQQQTVVTPSYRTLRLVFDMRL